MSTRQRLLMRAGPILLDQGIEGASVRALTEAAGANVASVNYYFGSRDGLIREVLGLAAGRLSAAWRDGVAAGEEPLDVFVVAVLDDPRGSALVARALNGAAAPLRNLVSAELAEGLEVLTGTLVSDGTSKPRPEVHRTLLLGLGAALLWLPQSELLDRLGGGRYRVAEEKETAGAIKAMLQASLDSPA